MREKHTCEKCKRVYTLESEKIIARDKDCINCKCGTELIDWNGSTIYSVVKIENEPEN